MGSGFVEPDEVIEQLVVEGFDVLEQQVFVELDELLLEGAVEALDLSIRSGMLDLGQAVLGVMFLAHPDEDVRKAVVVTAAVCELDAVVSQRRMDVVGHGIHQLAQKLRGRHFGGAAMQLGKSKLGRSVNGDKEVQLALGGMHLGDIDMEVADGITLEVFFDGLVSLRLRQPGVPWRFRQ